MVHTGNFWKNKGFKGQTPKIQDNKGHFQEIKDLKDLKDECDACIYHLPGI